MVDLNPTVSTTTWNTNGLNIPNKRQPKKTSPTNQTGKTVSTMTHEYIVIMKKED